MERKLIAVAVSSALALPMAAHAVEGSVSGHVNRAIISVDGGANDGDLQHVDSNASETRFRFTGSEDLGNGTTAGVQLELGRPSEWRTRHANVYLSGGFGKLTIGQASTAADNMAHARLGGPSWLGGVTNWCSYHSDSGGPACASNDGGRSDVLRYDTPAIGPASVAVSAGNNESWEIQAKVAGSMGGGFGYDIRIGHIAEYDMPTAAKDENIEVKMGRDIATIGEGMFVYNAINDARVRDAGNLSPDAEYTVYTAATPASTKLAGDILTVSAAFSFGQGTSAAVAWSQEDTGSQVEYQYVELDHSYGDGSVGVYYKTGEYGAGDNAGVEGSLWGVGIGHSLGGGATAYAGYRQYSEDNQEDVDLMLAGMRVTFN